MSLLLKIAAGAVAGVLATRSMTRVLNAGRAVGALGEPPPRKLVRKTLERLGIEEPSEPQLSALTNAAHYGFGALAGGLYGALPPLPRSAVVRGGLFGVGVWGASYAGWIPALGFMQAPTHDRPGRPTVMFLAHLVFGVVLGTTARKLSRGISPDAL